MADPALAALADKGIAVKILTGDNDVVARKVCKEVGLKAEGVLLGPQLAKVGWDSAASEKDGDRLRRAALGRAVATLKQRGNSQTDLAATHRPRSIRSLTVPPTSCRSICGSP